MRKNIQPSEVSNAAYAGRRGPSRRFGVYGWNPGDGDPWIGGVPAVVSSIEIHPKKVILRKLEWGIDFLGYIVLPHYILPRTKTKKRVFSKLKTKIHSANFNQSLQSYLGYLGHANSFKITQKLKNQIWLWR